MRASLKSSHPRQALPKLESYPADETPTFWNPPAPHAGPASWAMTRPAPRATNDSAAINGTEGRRRSAAGAAALPISCPFGMSPSMPGPPCPCIATAGTARSGRTVIIPCFRWLRTNHLGVGSRISGSRPRLPGKLDCSLRERTAVSARAGSVLTNDRPCDLKRPCSGATFGRAVSALGGSQCPASSTNSAP